MGKPYYTEIAQLNSTFEWGLKYDVSGLSQALLTAGALPLVAIGSGGSLTAAHFFASLHRYYTGQLATVATPFDVISENYDRKVSFWLLSAGGGNVDINSAFKELVSQEPVQLGVICGRPDSPLLERARLHSYVDTVEFSLPAGKDGFLATNSLLAFCIIIARAYADAYKNKNKCNNSSMLLECLHGFDRSVLTRWKEDLKKIWSRDTTIVIHGNASRIGAIDLESKFTEAALGNLQIADYRNFAHGRHHWLAKKGISSGILAFTTPEDCDLATKTLALIPSDIPIVRIDLSGNHVISSLDSLLAALHISGWAGAERGIDPGRPGVPEFGRKLYNLTLPRKNKKQQATSVGDAVVIERKAGVKIDRLIERGDFSWWQSELASFRKKLSAQTFSAIVFDYDGTLVDTRERFVPPQQDIINELIRILNHGVYIGIATGRGASIRRDLQSCLPQPLWERVIIGYYNGADIATLNDNTRPNGSQVAGDELAQLACELRNNSELKEIAIQEDRTWQITLKPCQSIPEDRLWDIANQVIQLHGIKVSIVRSSHSIDILAPSITKLSVINYITDRYGNHDNFEVLKIGDRGRWPGNDFALLRESFSLSVDELSSDPATCWNLAPCGHRGVQATLGYCRALKQVSGGVQFALRKKGNNA